MIPVRHGIVPKRFITVFTLILYTNNWWVIAHRLLPPVQLFRTGNKKFCTTNPQNDIFEPLVGNVRALSENVWIKWSKKLI